MNICRRSQREQKYKHIQVAECVGKDNHMWPFDKLGPGPHASDLHWFPRSAYTTLESCDPVEHEQSGLNPVHYPSKIVSHMFCILIWGQHKQKGRQFSGPVFRFLSSPFSFCSYLNSYLQSVYLNIVFIRGQRASLRETVRTHSRRTSVSLHAEILYKSRTSWNFCRCSSFTNVSEDIRRAPNNLIRT